MAQLVARGLAAPQKQLPSALFYDDEGSRLFQRIMALPEYYLTRTEHRLLATSAERLYRCMAPQGQPFELLELGSGDGTKTLSLCQELLRLGARMHYRPMDLSAHAMAELQTRFARHLPALRVQALTGDYFETWPSASGDQRQIALFLGSNLGNFSHEEAIVFLRRVRSHLRQGDGLLLGLDLKKDPRTVLAAYNDSEGLTAAFNLNLLVRLNLELGMNFDVDRFSHYASYSPLDGTARSFLVSHCAQRVHSRVLGQSFDFACGESIYTEQSQKYDQPLMAELARASGFVVHAPIVDEDNSYCLAFWQAGLTCS